MLKLSGLSKMVDVLTEAYVQARLGKLGCNARTGRTSNPEHCEKAVAAIASRMRDAHINTMNAPCSCAWSATQSRRHGFMMSAFHARLLILALMQQIQCV